MPKPADPLSDTLYDMPTLNRLFFASSILLIATTIWMAWQDYDRGWKHYQNDFDQIALKRAEKEAAALDDALRNRHGFELDLLQSGEAEARKQYKGNKNPDELAAAMKQSMRADWDKANAKLAPEKREEEFNKYWDAVRTGLEALTAQVKANEKDIEKLADEKEKGRGGLEKAYQKMQFLKSEADAAKFRAETASVALEDTEKHAAELKAKNDAGAAAEEAKLAGLRKDAENENRNFAARDKLTQEAKLAWEKLDREDKEAGAKIVEFTKYRDATEKALAKLEMDVSTKKRAIAKLQPDWKKTIRDAPLMDMLAPEHKIGQIITSMTEEVGSFAPIARIDRCTTCHLAVDKKGWTGSELDHTPFKSHPNLDLFVGDNSPHPISKYGCTICHNGQGRSVDFNYAAHTPQNAKQAADWKERYNWEPIGHYDAPMLPLQYAQASCTKCHSSQHRVDQAENLNEGKRLVETVGCYGCHPIAGTEDLRKPGPSLYGLKYKVTKDWAYNWIAKPTDFRPTTKMPQPFFLSNTSDEDAGGVIGGKRRNVVMIQGIVHYLFNQTDTPDGPKAAYTTAPAGDAAKGKKVIESVGCLACHVVGQFEEHGDEHRSFGPNLSAVGSKLNSGWVYAWLRDPKQYFHYTSMPQLRLSDEEAANATAYLMSLKHPDHFEDRKEPPVDEEALDATLVDFWKSMMSDAEAREKVAALSQDDKLTKLGERAIGHMGCFGCHDIKSFETTKKIGAELTGANSTGTKDITKFDFGYQHQLTSGHHPLPNDRINWVHAKLEDPRIYDEGRKIPYTDKLKMPKFNLSEEDIQKITTYVLSFRRESVASNFVRTLNHVDDVVNKGKRLATLSNCAGCHKVGLWTSEVELKGNEEENNSVEIANTKRVATARWVLSDGRQLDTLTPEELKKYGERAEAIAKLAEKLEAADDAQKPAIETDLRFARADVHLVLRKNVWLKPAMLTDILKYEPNVRSLIVFGAGEGGLRELVGETKAPPVLLGEGARVNPDWLFRFLKSPTMIRPWLQPEANEDPKLEKIGPRMPTFGFTDAEATTLVEHFAYLADQPWPFRYEAPMEDAKHAELVAKGKKVFERNECQKCHIVVGQPKPVTDRPAPEFVKVAPRIQKEWLEGWLRNPDGLQPGTGMPAFDEDKVKPDEVEALREFIWSLKK